MFTGAGKSIKAPFTTLINGCVVQVAWTYLVYYVINVRSGPFDRDDNFTTITIVINKELM